MKGRTSIMVAHRLSTIKHTDLIFVIDNGKVIEFGRHDDLILKQGIYNKLYELQFTDKEKTAS